MERQLWYILDDVMNLTKRRFLCFEPKISYDLLRMQYKLTYGLVWLERSFRRRENELISIVGLNVRQFISEEELISFPYFQQKIKAENKQEDAATYLIQLINYTPMVMQALLDEYSPKLSVDLEQKSIIVDRLSGENYVPAFLQAFPESGVFTEQFKEELAAHAGDFVVDAY